MRPSDRTIRDELRREAAKVSVPEDMWQNISRRLDEKAGVAEPSHRSVRRIEQWRPTVLLAVAAGFFWFALIPALPKMDVGDTKAAPGVVPAGQHEPIAKQTASGDYLVRKQSVAVDQTARWYPNLPQ